MIGCGKRVTGFGGSATQGGALCAWDKRVFAVVRPGRAQVGAPTERVLVEEASKKETRKKAYVFVSFFLVVPIIC